MSVGLNGYLNQNYSLIPLKGKISAIKQWNTEHSNDINQIDKWKSKFGQNFGLVTGSTNKLVVLDIDFKDQGHESLESLEAELGAIPETVTVKTGNGRHYYFYYDGIDIRNKVGLLKGIDIRAEGGYVVTAGSKHSNGKNYQFEEGLSFDDIPIAPLPQKIKEFILQSRPIQKDTSSLNSGLIKDLSEGARNSTLFKISCSLRDIGLEKEFSKNLLATINENHCKPQLSINDIETIGNSSWKYKKDRDLVIEPTFNYSDSQLFQTSLGKSILKICEDVEASPIAILTQLLTMFGNVVGRSIYFPLNASSNLYSNIYTVVVGETSRGRKGTSYGVANKIIFESTEQYGKCCKVGLSTGEGIIHAIRNPTEEDNGVSDKRLLLTETEFARALEVIKRDKETTSSVLRDSWDSPPSIATLTKTNPSIASDPHIGFIGHITPNEFRSKLSAKEISNGFANRFIPIYSMRMNTIPRAKNLDFSTLFDTDDFKRRINDLPINNRFELHSDALAYHDELYYKFEGDSRSELNEELKARGFQNLLKLALIFSRFHGQEAITKESLIYAEEIIDYSHQTIDFLFSKFAKLSKDAKKVLKEIKTHGSLNRTQIRDLFNRNGTKSLTLQQRTNSCKNELLTGEYIEVTESDNKETWTLKV